MTGEVPQNEHIPDTTQRKAKQVGYAAPIELKRSDIPAGGLSPMPLGHPPDRTEGY